MYQSNIDINVTLKENRPLVVSTIKKYFPLLTIDDDIYQIGLISLWQSILKFDETKGYKFSTFACNNIKNRICDELRRRQRRSVELSIEKFLYDDDGEETGLETAIHLDSNDDYSVIQAKELKDKFDGLGAKLKETVELVCAGYNQNDIAVMKNMSQQAINNRIKRARFILS